MTRIGTNSGFQLLDSVFAPYVVGCLGWIAAWWLNQQMSFLEISTGVALIFLPAGLRTLAVLIYGFRGAVGVFVGSLITGQRYFSGDREVSELALIVICLVSAFSAYVAMKAVCTWRHIPHDLRNLTLNDIFYIVISQGVLSATLHQVIFFLENVALAHERAASTIAGQWLVMLAGDVSGSLLLIGTFGSIATWLHRWATGKR